jgi:hypothetical protein
MTTETQTQRFFLGGKNYIVDKLTPANNGEGHYFGDKSDEMYLRECVLRRRLSDLVPNLIINNNPIRALPNGKQYQPYCEESHSLWWALFMTIKASHLNTLSVELSIRHRFDGDLKREVVGWQHSTSLSLFVEDVERLLRDLYGEADIDALDCVRSAVFTIANEFLRHLRKGLWQEHIDTLAIDYLSGIGLPEGSCIQGSDHGRAYEAMRDLALRARAVRTEPGAFGKYTVRFVEKLEHEWPKLDAAADSQLDLTMDEIPF